MTDVVIPSPERIKADVEHIKEWLSQEPHLAHIAVEEDEEWLETFLYNCKFSLEKTKYKLENLYFSRSKYPELFKNRDPRGEDLKELRHHYTHVLGHKVTKDGLLVIMMRYGKDSSSFDAKATLKILHMAYDMAMLERSNRLIKFACIIDLENISMGHMIKVAPVFVILAELSEKAYPLRASAVHIINLPMIAQKFLETMAKLFPEKMQKRIQIHGTKSSLIEAVDEEVVCSDFGGKGPSMAELQERLQKQLEEKTEWFETRGVLCSNEELRPKDSKRAEEMRGSFRKLDVD